MKWTEQKLAELSHKDGYRLRGESMTRIEVFSDAAFAFAVTMLVISGSDIPRNFDELLSAIQSIPSFAVSFYILMLIWLTHRRWSERFGLEDGVSTTLTLALVFVVLIYVYPLKLIIDLMFFALSPALFPTEYLVSNTTEVALLVAFFSAGFFLIAFIQLGLNLRTKAMTSALCLNRLEQVLVKKEILVWLVQSILAFIVTLLALVFMSSIGYLAGIIYSLTPLAIFFISLHSRKELQVASSDDV